MTTWGLERLSLESAIDKALSSSFSIQTLKKTLTSKELTYDGAWDKMFLPKVEMSLGVGSTYTIAKIPGNEDSPPPGLTSSSEHGYPTVSGLNLTLGQYTLFNFWKDFQAFEKAKMTWTRDKELYNEAVRKLRMEVILGFFKYKTFLDKLSAAKRSVETSEAILELLKSREKKGQNTSSDTSSATVDLLLAKNDLNNLTTQKNNALWGLNKLLGDPLGNDYEINAEIKFQALRLSPDQAVQIYNEISPAIRDKRLLLKTSEIDLSLAEKDRVPLPTITFSGLNIGYFNSYYGGGGITSTGSPFSTSTNPSSAYLNLNVSAAVQLTVPILGQDGFLGGRKVALARNSRDLNEISYRETIVNGQISIFDAVAKIKDQEQAITNNQQSLESINKVLADLMDQVQKGTPISRVDVRDALRQARESEFNLAEAKLSHLQGKLDLSQLLGVDHLPGDVY